MQQISFEDEFAGAEMVDEGEACYCPGAWAGDRRKGVDEDIADAFVEELLCSMC
jgi:hypothetical protein